MEALNDLNWDIHTHFQESDNHQHVLSNNHKCIAHTLCKASSQYSPSVKIVISGKSFVISFPPAVMKPWSDGECLKQAVHLSLGCTCPFSTPAGPRPQLAHPLLTRWGDRRQQSKMLSCNTYAMFYAVYLGWFNGRVCVLFWWSRGWLMHKQVSFIRRRDASLSSESFSKKCVASCGMTLHCNAN